MTRGERLDPAIVMGQATHTFAVSQPVALEMHRDVMPLEDPPRLKEYPLVVAAPDHGASLVLFQHTENDVYYVAIVPCF